MRRQDRPANVPPPLPNRPDQDLYLQNLRRSYRLREEKRRRDRRAGILLLIGIAIILAICCLAESAWSGTRTGGTPATPTEGVFDALTDWCRVAPKNPLRHAGYRAEVARALVAGAEAHGLPVEIVTAMTLRESSGRQDARGRAGEVGLMQISPDTAVRFRCRLTTPGEQVDCGARILARHLARCGTLRGALAVYGSRSGACIPKPGGPVERMVRDRLALAERLKKIIEGVTP